MREYYAVEIKIKGRFRRIFPKKISSKMTADRIYAEKVLKNPNKVVRLVGMDEFGEYVLKINKKRVRKNVNATYAGRAV